MYDVQFKRWPHYINIKSPYTFVKSIYYMETASLFLFITQKFIKSPNLITLLYIFSGISGSFLLNSPNKVLLFIGIFLIFTRGTFDWADGPLARRLNKTSFLGHVLDSYGAYINDAAFRVAFIYYTLKNFEDITFLLPIFVFTLLLTDFRIYSDSQILNTKKDSKNKHIKTHNFETNHVNESIKISNLKKWYALYISILDDRSRSIDFLLLIILFDYILDYDLTFLLLSLSILIVLRAIVIYVAGFYFAFKVYDAR